MDKKLAFGPLYMQKLVNSLTDFINQRGSDSAHPQFEALPEATKENLIIFINKFSHLSKEHLIGSLIFQKARHWKNDAKEQKKLHLKYLREQIITNCLITAYGRYVTDSDWVRIANDSGASQTLQDELSVDALIAFNFFAEALSEYEEKQVNTLINMIDCSDKDSLINNLKSYCQKHTDAWVTLSSFIKLAKSDPRYLRDMIKSKVEPSQSAASPASLVAEEHTASLQSSCSMRASQSDLVVRTQPAAISERTRISHRRELTESAFDEPDSIGSTLSYLLSLVYPSPQMDTPAAKERKRNFI